jgi:hypothetical protein
MELDIAAHGVDGRAEPFSRLRIAMALGDQALFSIQPTEQPIGPSALNLSNKKNFRPCAAPSAC